ncbi:MAG: hypothetical protein ACP5N9_01165 [Candidatus Bilamarchaeum sp.]
MKFDNKLILIGGIIVIGFFIFFILNQKSQPGLLGEIHNHADFKVYLNGNQYNFSQEKYMTNKNLTLSNFVHLHDLNGDLIHQHIKGISVGEFFDSINMTFNLTCFKLDNGTSYCNNGISTLKMYVKTDKGSWNRNHDLDHYEFNDLDKILITYGYEDYETVKDQMATVTDRACIESGKCPEKGLPSDESSCVSGKDCIA